MFFPSHGEEMQTTSFHDEEKDRLNNSNNNPEACGQTMSGRQEEPPDRQTQELRTRKRGLVSPVAGQPQCPESPAGPWLAGMEPGRQRRSRRQQDPRQTLHLG